MKYNELLSLIPNITSLDTESKKRILFRHKHLDTNKSRDVRKFLTYVFSFFNLSSQDLQLNTLDNDKKKLLVSKVMTILQLRKTFWGGYCLMCNKCSSKIKINSEHPSCPSCLYSPDFDYEIYSQVS